MTKSLTDTQRVILANAAARDDRRVLPVPTTLNKNAGALALCLRATLTSGLIAEVPAAAGDVRWGTDDNDQPTTLWVSDLGQEAIGIPTDEESLQISPPPAPVTSSPRAGSKLDLLTTRLGQPEGATIDELVAITGWQKHSVRGAMSGALKTKRKLDVTSVMTEGRGRVYRIRPRAHPDIAAVVGDHR